MASSSFQQRIHRMMDTKWPAIDATFHATNDIVNFNFEFIDNRLLLSINTIEIDASLDICPRNTEADNVMAMFSFKGYNQDLAAARYKDIARRVGLGSYANDTCFSYFDVAEHDSEYSDNVMQAIEVFVDSVIEIKQVFTDFADTNKVSKYGFESAYILPMTPMNIIEQIL